jgi:hypothetical protein
MFDFFIGVLVGAVVIDFLWAWQHGIPQRFWQRITTCYMLYRAKDINWKKKKK